jgi:hypothetical protein
MHLEEDGLPLELISLSELQKFKLEARMVGLGLSCNVAT